ncbi:MAG: AAA family ATPase [Bacillota bacterium]
MKPISLKLSGLHSFREPQAVNFERLCEAGLFGIFGPTGSGKSTILDAITLSLYGKVERASHGTHGILNHSEQRVLVEFTFELNHPEGRKCYRVERVYRRGENNSVTTAGARLVEVTAGGEVPLAEKAGAVTSQIEALLGLNADDFTRAVVLPQGKFDEFLKKIKPVDRRGMLERLFGLAEYGEKLRQKVDGRLQEAARKLAGIQGELDGLGDASDEALELAEQQLVQARERAEKAEERYRLAEQKFKATEELWKWHEELAGVEGEAALLRERQPEILRLEEKLDAAARAGKAQPFLAEVDEAATAYADARKNLTDAQAELALADQAAGTAEERLKQTRESRQREEPGLQAYKTQLVRGVALEKEISELKKEGESLLTVLKALQGEKDKVETAVNDQRREKQQLEEALQDCRARIAETHVAPERRRQVAAAWLALRQWRDAQTEYAKAQAYRREKDDRLRKARQSWADAVNAERQALVQLELAVREEKEVREKRPPDDDSALQDLVRELERLRSLVDSAARLATDMEEVHKLYKLKQLELADIENAYQRAVTALEAVKLDADEAQRLVRTAEERLNELRSQNMAGHLARLLKAGEPCPVCGSTEHPLPALTGGEEEITLAEKDLRDAQAFLVTAQDALEKAQREESTAAERLRLAGIAVQEIKARLASLENEMTSICQGMPGGWAGPAIEEMQTELSRRDTLIEAKREAWVNWQEKLDEKSRALQAAREAHNEKARALVQAESVRLAAEAAAREAAERLSETEAQVEQCLVRLNETRGEIPVEKLEEINSQIQQFDAQRAILEMEREQLENELADIARNIEGLLARHSDLSSKVSGTQEKLAALRATYREKDAELRGITNGRPAGELLERTEVRLRELAAAEEQAQEAARRTAQEKAALEQAVAAAQKAVNLAEERLDKGTTRLYAVLRELRFATRNEAEQALLTLEEQEELQKKVKQYREESERLAGLIRNLREKLADRTASSAEWQACQNELAAAQRERTNALEQRGAAQRERQRVADANVRWKELKKLADKTGALKKRLETLKELFRGNTFVDFLAEEQLDSVTHDASVRLGQLTNHRYALEVDSEGGFVIRDEANGGVKRPVSTLSGGETFVTSLALALALSAQIQLKGRYPLEFFFLDEGFGSLDPDLLEVVVSTLERLHLEHLNIGVISHVPELRNRLPRRLIVHPADPSGTGSRLELEMG